jgi:hypothetical protein
MSWRIAPDVALLAHGIADLRWPLPNDLPAQLRDSGSSTRHEPYDRAVFLHVIIDGRDVLASGSAPVGERELVEGAARWASSHPRTPIVAVVLDDSYDGAGPGMYEHDERTVVVVTEGDIAGDVIVGEVEELRAESEPVIVVTGDAALRERVEAHGAKVIDGGAFLRTVLA